MKVEPMGALRVVAIISAFNEADIIGEVIADLLAQGLNVYFIDDGSTDGTIEMVEPFVGRGVLHIERRVPGETSSGLKGFEWTRILRHKAQLATELDGDWFIHHDSDEFRESPWPSVPLRDAISYVDRTGFNAIDFECLNFSPSTEPAQSGTVREWSSTYTSPAAYDRVQIRCWKRTAVPVDLETSGGHEACFPDRRVFPIRFVLRHYPLRDEAHAQRKILVERRPRYLPEERARGWHVQYDHIGSDHPLLSSLEPRLSYEPDRVRLQLMTHHMGVEALERAVASATAVNDRLSKDLADTHGALVTIREELALRSTELELGAQQRSSLETRVLELEREVERRSRESEHQRIHSEHLESVLDARTAEIAECRTAIDELTRRIDEIHESRTWRWTAGARAAYRLLAGLK